MKRVYIILCILIVSLLAGCKSSKEESVTWYSINDELILHQDGTYQSTWLTEGLLSKYTAKGNTYTLSAPDKSERVFSLNKDSGKKTLTYISESGLVYIYYDNKEDAQKEKEDQEASEKTKEEELEKQKITELKDNLVGIWEWVGNDTSIEFTNDGKYIFQNYKRNEWTYKIIDSVTIEISKDTGERYNVEVELIKESNEYSLLFQGIKYIRSKNPKVES